VLLSALRRAGHGHDAHRFAERSDVRPDCRRPCDQVELCSCPSDRALPFDEYLHKLNRRAVECRGTPQEAARPEAPEAPAGRGADSASDARPSYAGPRIGDVSPTEAPVKHAQRVTHRREAYTPLGNVIDVFG